MRAAGEIAFAAIDAREPGFDALDVHRLAAVRGASEREFVVADAQGIGGAAFDERDALAAT